MGLLRLERGAKVVMFAGKGGVGKTTLSATTALHFAEKGYKTLILTSDPAPSLSDIFERDVGDRITEVTDNLYALELSTDEVLRRWKEKFGGEVYEVLSSLVPVQEEIIDYIGSAPGIDEEFMLDYIAGLAREGEYDKIVWDTAPAGHTLRLLKMPIIFIEHLDEAAKVYLRLYSAMLKIRETLGLKKPRREIFDIISGWRKLSEELLEFLRSPQVEVIPVGTPQGLSVSQVKRLMQELENFGIRVNKMVMNSVVLEPECEFHRRVAEVQQRYLKELREAYPEVELVEVPLLPHEIKGLGSIKEMENLLFG
jgi:arsenite-transporting ATPase